MLVGGTELQVHVKTISAPQDQMGVLHTFPAPVPKEMLTCRPWMTASEFSDQSVTSS